MKIRYLIALIMVLFMMASCASVPGDDRSEVWIDVRSPEEHRLTHIGGHENIPHSDITEYITDLVPGKDTPVYLYCRSGNRAGKAKTALEEMGYTNVFNAGGIDDVRAEMSAQN